MEEDMRNLCKAVGLSIDKIAKKYGVKQENLLELFMQMMNIIQEKLKE